MLALELLDLFSRVERSMGGWERVLGDILTGCTASTPGASSAFALICCVGFGCVISGMVAGTVSSCSQITPCSFQTHNTALAES